MWFQILGPVEMSGGSAAGPTAGRPRALLARLLLSTNRVVSVERLIDDLWEDRPPATAAKILQNWIAQLRRDLGDQRERLATHPRGYSIRADPGELDSAQFKVLVTRARGEFAGGNPTAAVTTLDVALSLWRGPPLAEFAGERWAAPAIAELEELRVRALEQRVDARLALGDSGELVPELTQLVRQHPLRERLSAQLMTALYRSGRQAEALGVYRSTREALDEIGIEPTESLNRLHTRMLQHDPALSPADLAATVPPQPTVPSSRRRRSWIVGLCGVALAVVVVGFVLQTWETAAPTAGRTSRVVLVIGSPAPTENGHAVATAPTLATSMATGAETLRRQGVPIRIVYAPGLNPVRDTTTIESAAAHAGLVVIFPAAFATLNQIAAAARRHPQTRFAVIDTTVREAHFPPNVAGIHFNNRELGYLAGYLSALEGGRPPVVSAVAGIRGILSVERILQGFRTGALVANPATRVIVRYSGTFLDRAACEAQANHEIDAGSRVVFDVAGTCGLGALDAANLRGVWGVGIDTDLSYLTPAILASAVKRFDNAVEFAVQLYLQHRLPRKADVQLNAANDGIELMGISPRVSDAIRQRLARVTTELEQRDADGVTG
jgi:basic membrane lipoprotein Med (substrate-binding protein (PBP1-ABC) superfamily)/DNA-binding SARP family transcriptional activator